VLRKGLPMKTPIRLLLAASLIVCLRLDAQSANDWQKWKEEREQNRKSDPIEEALRDIAQRAHEREMQQRQLQHEAEMRAARPAAPLPSMDEFVTLGHPNGRAWLLMSEEFNSAYVRGHLDALAIHATPEVQDLWARCQCGPLAIATGVAAYYRANPAYARMPVAFAMKLFVWKSVGTGQNIIDAEAARMMSSVANAR